MRICCRLLLSPPPSLSPPFFFFNDTATPEIYPLSLPDALPIFPLSAAPAARRISRARRPRGSPRPRPGAPKASFRGACAGRSEEHTSELQSRLHLVCRLLLEKKKRLWWHRCMNLTLRVALVRES